ncbi:LOW QUALITY PROTEIN: hypothetical protein BDA96_02G270600 [Sorghum bicolor]|uniref:Nuclear transport factor 2 domain-containing protein n=1 Tax=Sorghum bicolor TaxID=4558 RepID=A0A921RQZ3_SORBI|nr:LOW QUALITY PROTEIN: hypothetical protein BDA96_02G270600 [Sorghum bicolor]
MDLDSVAKVFVNHYYTTFNTNRVALAIRGGGAPMLTFEGDKYIGATAIIGKLTSLLFVMCKQQLSTPTSGMLVFVSGAL